VGNHWSNRFDDLGETPTSRVLRSGHARLVSLVMRVSEEPGVSEENVPELIRFARNSQVREVRECMEQGHDFNVVDSHGLTAMHWAAITGCDLTPLNIARLMGYDEVARFLVKHGGLE